MGACARDGCEDGRSRPLVACEQCGRHVARDAERCPFCDRKAPSRLRGALVAAAFFGSAAIAGCAYGLPPDDLDASAEVSADGANEVQADAPGEVQADAPGEVGQD